MASGEGLRVGLRGGGVSWAGLGGVGEGGKEGSGDGSGESVEKAAASSCLSVEPATDGGTAAATGRALWFSSSGLDGGEAGTGGRGRPVIAVAGNCHGSHRYFPDMICRLTRDTRYPCPMSSKVAPDSVAPSQRKRTSRGRGVEGPRESAKRASRDPPRWLPLADDALPPSGSASRHLARWVSWLHTHAGLACTQDTAIISPRHV